MFTFASLPVDVVERILLLLTGRQLGIAELVEKYLHDIISSHRFWHLRSFASKSKRQLRQEDIITTNPHRLTLCPRYGDRSEDIVIESSNLIAITAAVLAHRIIVNHHPDGDYLYHSRCLYLGQGVNKILDGRHVDDVICQTNVIVPNSSLLVGNEHRYARIEVEWSNYRYLYVKICSPDERRILPLIPMYLRRIVAQPPQV